MVAHLNPEQEARLHLAATLRGVSADLIAQLAVAHYLQLKSSVQLGLEEAERGELIDHDELFDELERRYS